MQVIPTQWLSENRLIVIINERRRGDTIIKIIINSISVVRTILQQIFNYIWHAQYISINTINSKSICIGHYTDGCSKYMTRLMNMFFFFINLHL